MKEQSIWRGTPEKTSWNKLLEIDLGTMLRTSHLLRGPMKVADIYCSGVMRENNRKTVATHCNNNNDNWGSHKLQSTHYNVPNILLDIIYSSTCVKHIALIVCTVVLRSVIDHNPFSEAIQNYPQLLRPLRS